MNITAFTLVALFSGSGALASTQEPVYDCVAPQFPAYSTSNEGVRRVEKLVREWRACNVERAALIDAARLVRLNEDVDLKLEKWIIATRGYASGQLDHQTTLTRIERDKLDYALWLQNAHRVVYKAERR